MRKRTRYKSLLIDILVILLCLSAAAFFAWLFWRDLNTFTVRGDKAEIGTISFKYNVVQRKFDDRVVWERIANGTKLYYGDTIRTADMAGVDLVLGDTEITLGENTMIQLSVSDNGVPQIAISGGDIQIDSTTASSNLEVKLDDGSVVNIDAGSSLAAKADSATGIHNVEVKSGTAQITTESGETAELAYGESVNVEKGKEIQKNPVTVIYPPKELKLLNVGGEAVPVRFEWKSSGGDAVTIQTSYSRDFTKIVNDRKIENSSTAELRIENGVIFWRAFTADTKDKAVEGKVTVESISSVQGISPANATSFRYRTALPRVAFRWSGNEYAERYRLLISSTPDMRSVVSDSEVTGNFVSLDDLEEGNYWWQVTPFYSLSNLGYAGESEVYSFNIVRSQQIRRPELSSPADNAQIVYKENIPANFIWKSELKNARYELTIARDYDFTNVAFTTETSDTRYNREFAPNELRDGTYYWKILRKSAESDDTNPESEIRAFRVVRYIPQDNKLLYPPENFSVEGAKVAGTAFMWKLADDYDKAATVSVIQIATNPNFQNIQIERATNATVLDNLSLPSGNYWWRVGVRDSNGALTALTQSRMFTVLSELSPPSIISPLQNQEITVYNYSPVTVAWNPVGEASYYSAKITKTNGELVKENSNIQDTQAQFVLEEGNYIAHVQAIADSTRISVASERNFSVRAPSAILAQSPADGARIAGLAALRTPTVFTWISGRDRVSSYKFILSKIQKDGSSKVVESIDTAKPTVSLNRLTEGTYTWKIAASTSAGIPIDSKVQRFVVETVPNLESPVLDTPAQNFVIDGEYLKTHRVIEFTWKEVAGATAYTFTLYKRESDGSRKLVYTEKNTKAASARIRDLSILSVGTFEWTVTPFSYAKDGYLEQSGSASSRTFSINFASPTRVEGVQPGKMYGN